MTNTICLDESFSTTKLLKKDKPSLSHSILDSESGEDKFKTMLFLPEGEERQGEGGLRTKGFFKKSYENKPLITVVTVVYNGEAHLKQTIQSVIDQSYDNVEYIIVDGGSTDGTLDIIRRYEGQIDYWVSEVDNGLYYAMNKSVILATGKWINFMNAGDSFYDTNVLASLFDATGFGDASVVYGDVMKKYNQQYQILRKNKPLELFYQELPFSHQAAFVKTVLLKRYPFDTQYRLSADYDLFFNLYHRGLVFVHLPRIVATFDMFGVSSNYAKLFLDKKQVSFQYQPEKASYFNNVTYLLIGVKELIKSLLPNHTIMYIRIILAKLYVRILS